VQFLKWGLFFVLSFIISSILIFTFSQEPFRQEVPARIITYNTPMIPIYVYVVGAFTIGLFLGLAVAVYNFITGRKQIGRMKKDLKERTRQVEELQIRANQIVAAEEEREQREHEEESEQEIEPRAVSAREQEDQAVDSPRHDEEEDSEEEEESLQERAEKRIRESGQQTE
jgi:pyruvate/2-oxoacid:ferredoxin oxidoreductase alpha subunit